MSGSLAALLSRTRAALTKSFSGVTVAVPTRQFNSNRASITRIHRLQYLRTYPVVLVNQDGSTVNIRYHEPRKIVKLPFDISNLSEDQRKLHLERRKPKTRVTLEDDSEKVGFDAHKYLKILKKK